MFRMSCAFRKHSKDFTLSYKSNNYCVLVILMFVLSINFYSIISLNIFLTIYPIEELAAW